MDKLQKPSQDDESHHELDKHLVTNFTELGSYFKKELTRHAKDTKRTLMRRLHLTNVGEIQPSKHYF